MRANVPGRPPVLLLVAFASGASCVALARLPLLSSVGGGHCGAASAASRR